MSIGDENLNKAHDLFQEVEVDNYFSDIDEYDDLNNIED